MAEPVVALRNVTKRFPGVIANDDVSLDIVPGEVHVLLGENGAGKSTLIGMLAGMQQPDAGEILIDGKPIRITSPRHALALGIGTVFQNRMMVPALTVAENLLLGQAWWKRPDRAGVRQRFAKSCADFGITIDIDAEAGDLALGAQQQVEIIRALWRAGRVIVLDEPTAMLTPQGIAELGSIMGRMKQQGIAVVFITHHLDEALEFGDRITVLRRGRTVGELMCAALRAMPRADAMQQVVEMMFGELPDDLKAAAAGGLIAKHEQGFRKPMLYLEGLTARDGRGRAVIEDISFEVKAGEIFGIAGVDGNGQTQLAQAIVGQLPATGTIALDGIDVSHTSVPERNRAGIRYVTDDRNGEGTVSSLPVSINLLMKRIGEPPFWSRGMIQGGLVDKHARELIRDYDIRTPSTETPIGRLSGGNIQKALIARELYDGAKLIIYNKPTHGLDFRNIEATRRRIAEGAERGLPTILISTDLDEVLELSHRIGVMVRGRLVGIVENGPDARRLVGAKMTGAEAA